MGQRKLSTTEKKAVSGAYCCICNMCPWEDTHMGTGYWHGVKFQLTDMLTHGTTDGKPYVEPQPEIGDGYRVATEADKDRGDMEIYIGDGWAPRANVIVPHVHLKYFRVPINPKAEIGEGYRVATEADSLRSDLEEWDFTSRKWKPGFIVGTDTTYRVPIDRIPTDLDARERPTVMVRNVHKWDKAVLLAVLDTGVNSFVVLRDGLVAEVDICRRPYFGE